MKGNRIKYLLVVACIESRMLCMTVQDAEWTVSKIIHRLAFGNVWIAMDGIALFLVSWFPILFFQVLMGNYIYENYCVSSVYFFSRCTKKTKWYLKEAGKLYLYVLLYVITIFGSAWICQNMLGTVKWDETAGILLTYYLLIYSLWIFMTTLFINVAAILLDSTKSFVIMSGVQLGCFGLYGILQDWLDFSEYEGVGMEAQIMVLKAIPMSNLVFQWHSSDLAGFPQIVSSFGFSYDFMQSFITVLVFTVIIFGVGMVIVKKADFIDNGGTM